MKIEIFTTFLLLTIAAQAGTVAITSTETFSSTVSTTIPDGNLNGLVQTITATPSISKLEAITVTLEISGGWNGDLYAYLWHDGEISVLLNRIGRTSSQNAGSSGAGMQVTFDDSGIEDVHLAAFTTGNILTGTFQPDARYLHPTEALDTSPRPKMLSDMLGTPAAGEYRLFIADVATGDQATLTNWSITLTGMTVPEPSSLSLGALAVTAMFLRRQRA